MTQYIPKSALVAEIENLENTYNKCPTRNSYEEGLKEGRLIGYKDALHKIDTQEVKEVDVEKEFSKWWKVERIKDYNVDALYERYSNTSLKLAKHFFELGLKATQKGE